MLLAERHHVVGRLRRTGAHAAAENRHRKNCCSQWQVRRSLHGFPPDCCTSKSPSAPSWAKSVSPATTQYDFTVKLAIRASSPLTPAPLRSRSRTVSLRSPSPGRHRAPFHTQSQARRVARAWARARLDAGPLRRAVTFCPPTPGVVTHVDPRCVVSHIRDRVGIDRPSGPCAGPAAPSGSERHR